MEIQEKKKSNIIKSLQISLVFTLIFWIIAVIQMMGFDLSALGILPRSEAGMIGIVTSPFVHRGVQHLMANTIPFFLLSFLLFLFYKRRAFTLLGLIWVTTGFLTWLIGRTGLHLGASGIIYGLASFLVFGGILSRSIKLLIPAILVIILYSGLVLSIFPNDPQVSWEAHLAGAVSGLLWAIAYRKTLRIPEYY